MEKEWEEKRRSRGILIPLFYLALEAVLLLLILDIFKTLRIETITQIVTVILSLYFFLSCLPRFLRVVRRQKPMRTITASRLYR